ncbi:hypothetical protein LILAB_35225 [Corallococcus macrosporus]|uniref:AB hydrolase-1 domain-containing protein n=2 Tax=Myxococcaceae TaxID=31 RepID=F8CKJ3_MYXFH|nr:hypothetical protein LILAB_35225 [Corallococcus macrosporus]
MALPPAGLRRLQGGAVMANDALPSTGARVSAEVVQIPARDGLPLAATVYQGRQDNGVAVQVNPATAVPRRYYDAFARFLAGRGFTVVTYDYRAMGDSVMGAALRDQARFQDWGELDTPAVMDWVTARFPSHRLSVVGHSAGGQMLGLAENASRIQAVLLVGSQHGWWRHWPMPLGLAVAALSYVALPVSAALLGRFPGRAMGAEDLPGGIARQWASWCRNPHYVSDAHGAPLRPYNDRVRARLRLYSFSDDAFAPEAAARALLDYYPNATREHLHRTPAELGMKRVGHFGWFRASTPEAVWAEAADWLAQVTSLPTETRAL